MAKRAKLMGADCLGGFVQNEIVRLRGAVQHANSQAAEKEKELKV